MPDQPLVLIWSDKARHMGHPVRKRKHTYVKTWYDMICKTRVKYTDYQLVILFLWVFQQNDMIMIRYENLIIFRLNWYVLQYDFFPRRLIENQWFKIYAFNQKIPWNPFETKQFEFRGNSNFLVIVSLKLGAFGPNWKLIWEDAPFEDTFKYIA